MFPPPLAFIAGNLPMPCRALCRAVTVASWLLLANFAPATCGAEEESFGAEQIEFFENQVRPILVARCYSCHSTDAKQLRAELYVDSREGLLQGGESGAAIIPGRPDESPLIAAVKYELNEMPPDGKLTGQEIAALVKWVELGAPWPGVTALPARSETASSETGSSIDWPAARAAHWAWQPIRQLPLPVVGSSESAASAIDRFVSARRATAGLSANSLADPAVLARRIFIDLIGLLPTPAQLHDFVDAARTDRQRALETLVDQLLASPLYGQRWARHWLDVARYSDGRGGFLDNESLDDAWRYRNWVVDAFNADLPIDRFIRLQIAGDLLAGQQGAIATGFFALGPTYQSDGGDPDSIAQARGETLDDRIDLLSRGLLGITASCARCHDHKFDPIPQQDYYSLAGVFNNTDTHRLPLAPAEVVARFHDYQKAVSERGKQIQGLQQKLKQEGRAATASEQAELQAWHSALDNLKKNPPSSYDTTHALRDVGDQDMHVAVRGNLRKSGDLVPRRFLRIIAGPDSPPFTSGSGRLELAEAIVARDNPLTARVFVNRIWMHHFGDGLVRTPSNFGTLGEFPTHPDLLDWLAADLVQQGWSLKRLHRQIMTSHTYQLSSEHQARGMEEDADNRWLWRMNPRRMDIEVWRDAMLHATQELDVTPLESPLIDLAQSPFRTLYAQVSRSGDAFAADEFLRRFDFPVMRATVAKRPRSIVPQQFLFLLNGEFMVRRARALLARLEREATTDRERIQLAYQILYSRAPEDAEVQIGLKFLGEPAAGVQFSAWEQYAQVLLSANEFMFVR